MKDYARDLYKKLSENIGETPELFHYDYFKLEDGELYYKGSRKPLMTKGVLKSVGMIADILGKNRLRRLGFNIPVGKLTAHHHRIGRIARVKLTLHLQSSLSCIAILSSAGFKPASSLSTSIYVLYGRPTLVYPCAGVQNSSDEISSSLLR